MAQTKPAPGTWTYEDLFDLPDDGRRYEIIEGELYETPSPKSAHALAVINLIALLLPVVARFSGRLLTVPIDVFIPGANPVQPDILVILPNGLARIAENGVDGAPDLLIEVLIPSNRAHDLLTKRALYGRAGARIVDPDVRTLGILTLDRDALHRVTVFSGNETPASPLLGSLPITAAEMFAGIED